MSKQFNTGDVVIFSENMTPEQSDQLREAIESIGLTAAIGGEAIEPTELNSGIPSSDINLLTKEWAEKYKHTVDPTYLEEVVVGEGDDYEVRNLLTATGMKRAYLELNGENSSTSISFGHIKKSIRESMSAVATKRDYLAEGAVFLGNKPRPTYHNLYAEWAFEPEAVHGLIHDQYTPYLGAFFPKQCFGDTGRANMSAILSHISDAPIAFQREESGWVGSERNVQIG